MGQQKVVLSKLQAVSPLDLYAIEAESSKTLNLERVSDSLQAIFGVLWSLLLKQVVIL